MVEEEAQMASLYAAKQQLRSAMKQRLGAISHESVMSQSTTCIFPTRELGSTLSAKPRI